jgi:hypothetical protein
MGQEKKSYGALIGSIIIIVILIVGGIYIWQTKVKEMKLEQKRVQMQAAAINAANMNELKTLEQDLNSTDVNTGVDAETIK